jgi:hypothetical protein
MLMLVKGQHEVLAIRLLPMQRLNGMLFFLTVLLPTTDSCLEWPRGGMTVPGTSFFLPSDMNNHIRLAE